MARPSYDSFYADYAPPKGHPLCWLFREKPSDLAYVSWGHRWYGDAPAVPSLHDGWHYFVVLEGQPSLVVRRRSLGTRPGMVSVSHPDCAVGHGDAAGRRCEMLTWVWRSPPAHPALEPRPAGHLRLSVDRATLKRLKALHIRCRQALLREDDLSPLELRSARLELDLCLAHAGRSGEPLRGDFPLNLAVEFFQSHVGDRRPVRHAAEYLQISEAALGRLFRRHLGKNPRTYALERRMEWARRELGAPGASVGSVARALGYRHANDFSRAFSRHYRTAASRVLAAERPSAPRQ